MARQHFEYWLQYYDPKEQLTTQLLPATETELIRKARDAKREGCREIKLYKRPVIRNWTRFRQTEFPG